jgi:hypothetical protein
VRRYPKQGIVVDRPIRRKDCTSEKESSTKSFAFSSRTSAATCRRQPEFLSASTSQYLHHRGKPTISTPGCRPSFYRRCHLAAGGRQPHQFRRVRLRQLLFHSRRPSLIGGSRNSGKLCKVVALLQNPSNVVVPHLILLTATKRRWYFCQ